MGSYRELNPDQLASSEKERNSSSSPMSEKEAQPPSGKAKALLNIRRKSAEVKNILSLRRKSVELSLNTSLDFEDKLLTSYTEAISKNEDDTEVPNREIVNPNLLKVSVSNEYLSPNSQIDENSNPFESNELRRSKSDHRISGNIPIREQDSNFLMAPQIAESPRISPHPAFRKRLHSNSKTTNQVINEDMGKTEESEIQKTNTQISSTKSTHWKMDPNNVLHKGGCHCGSVRFEVYAPSNPTVIDCNCSICVKKQNRHFIVPAAQFKIVKGHNSLTTYTFNSHKAKHIFCSKCGVQSFYIPRSNSDGYGIAPHCLDEGTLKKEKIEKFNGKQWEEEMQKKSHIQALSKPKE